MWPVAAVASLVAGCVVAGSLFEVAGPAVVPPVAAPRFSGLLKDIEARIEVECGAVIMLTL